MRAFGLVALAFLCSTAHAQLVDTIPDLDHLATEPGAEVTRSANGDFEAVTLNRNGVFIRSERRGDKGQTTGVDGSGHGAVLCNWSIYIETRQTLDVCFTGTYPELHQHLDEAINQINGFIVANSLVPTSLTTIESNIRARDTVVKAKASSLGSDRLAKACSNPDTTGMVTALSRQSAADWQKAMADLISNPRPPVMNPCL